MRQPIVDYHMHTPLCGHASGQPREYAEQALRAGLSEIGFSDHAPLLSHRDPGITMDFDQLPLYCQMIEQVQKEFQGRLTVRLGIEADFLPGFEAKTAELLKQYPYDYVIGSVHFIDNWCFDNPDEIKGWDHADTNRIYGQYYDYLRRSAASRLFDVMGHVELVKKFGHRPTTSFMEEIKKTAEAFRASGVAIEINTSGLRKPVKEIYPSLDILKVYCQAGIPITFGSDAHAAADVGKDFDQAGDLARAAGYKEYVGFCQRKIVQTFPLY